MSEKDEPPTPSFVTDASAGVGHLINTYQHCPQCGGADFELRDYDETWRDGTVWCRPCNVFVRHYDAG